MVTKEDYLSSDENAWCPGCGNFGILNALKSALAKSGLNPYEIMIVSGIGQAPKLPHYLKCNAFNGLHGRVLPVAQAIKLSNHKLKVIGLSGDGDAYAEGGNHFIHAIRRNSDITYLVHNNRVYGLTKGQTSPTTDLGFKSSTTPLGSFDYPINPIALAISLNCSFAARGFSGEIEHLTGLMKEAMEHKGFSLIDILQPCVSFNKVNTFEWYKQRVYKLESGSHNLTDKFEALKKADEWGEKIPIGVIYKNERATLEDNLVQNKEIGLVNQPLNVPNLGKILEQFL